MEKIYVDTRGNLFRLWNKSPVFFASRRFYLAPIGPIWSFFTPLEAPADFPRVQAILGDHKNLAPLTAQKSDPAPPQLTTLKLASQHAAFTPSFSSYFSRPSIMAGRPAPEQPTPFPWRSDMLAGKKAIVTGGSAGIGAAITEALVSVAAAVQCYGSFGRWCPLPACACCCAAVLQLYRLLCQHMTFDFGGLLLGYPNTKSSSHSCSKQSIIGGPVGYLPPWIFRDSVSRGHSKSPNPSPLNLPTPSPSPFLHLTVSPHDVTA